jgi:hypothetical protein
MLIAVHRWGGVVYKKTMGILNATTIFTPRQYIHIYPIFILEVPFNPFWNHVIKPQNYLLTKFFMSTKYIQDSMMLTKEAFIEAALRQQQAEATQYGLTLDEWQQAILSGSVVQAKSPSDLPPKQ